MVNHLILGLTIGIGLYLARALFPFVYLALLAIAVWVGVGLVVLWSAIGVVCGNVRAWFVD
jgi:hypothetical protein